MIYILNAAVQLQEDYSMNSKAITALYQEWFKMIMVNVNVLSSFPMLLASSGKNHKKCINTHIRAHTHTHTFEVLHMKTG